MSVDPRNTHLLTVQRTEPSESPPQGSSGSPAGFPYSLDGRSEPGRVVLAVAAAVAVLVTAMAMSPVSAHDVTEPADDSVATPTSADTTESDTGQPDIGQEATGQDADAPVDAAEPDAAAGTESDGGEQTAEQSEEQPPPAADETDADETGEADDADEADDAEAAAETAADGNAIPDIVFPVVGPVSYVDTWGACRGTRCSRSHKGVDIFAIKLAPLVAAADGVITADRRSATGVSGNTVIVTGDDGWRYLYIHLNNDGPGTDNGSNPQAWIIPNRLRIGDRVSAGDVIGYVGDSGNAETTPSHVHFEIHQPGVGAINPTPIVRTGQTAGRVISVASLASSANGRTEYGPTVAAWYRALLKREPTEMELFAWTDRFDIGFATTDDLIADLTMAKPRRDAAGTVIRAFEVSLDRRPTLNEIRAWEDAYRNGADLNGITQTLIQSGTFRDRHGELSDEGFVRAIYQNAVGVDPTDERLADWLARFAEGSPRSTLTAYWGDSYSVKNSTWHGLEVVQSFRAALDRMPTDDEYAQWVSHLDGGGLIPDVVDSIRSGG